MSCLLVVMTCLTLDQQKKRGADIVVTMAALVWMRSFRSTKRCSTHYYRHLVAPLCHNMTLTCTLDTALYYEKITFLNQCEHIPCGSHLQHSSGVLRNYTIKLFDSSHFNLRTLIWKSFSTYIQPSKSTKTRYWMFQVINFVFDICNTF